MDVADVLEGGVRGVVRVLMGMWRLLEGSETYWVYGKVWLEDFLGWVQSCVSDDDLRSLAKEVREAKMEKGIIGWDLQELEHAAEEMMERGEDSDDEDEEEVAATLL